MHVVPTFFQIRPGLPENKWGDPGSLGEDYVLDTSSS